MTEIPHDPKITASHLARRALIYLRQSSPGQVQRNTESTRLQYALKERARQFGWHDVEEIDSDLGSSASLGARRREGFERVIALVAQKEVGIVLTREVSRLLRTDKDWCRLMEVCQVFDTLVGDDEQIYDLNLMGDQLVLGIKGTLSVVELKVLRQRLQQGRQAKAQRGELRRLLPPGYVYDADGAVTKDPNRRVQEAMALVFQRFQELRSIRQTFKWFHDEGIELPVNEGRGPGRGLRLCWKLPSHSFINDVLRNPWYAGAYVWGRRPQQVALKDGNLLRSIGSVCEPEKCSVFIPDHHEAYLSWEQYMENRRIRQRNVLFGNGDASVAGVRAGRGLLGGLLRCGRCGRRMHVRYTGRKGTTPFYHCPGDYHVGGEYCLSFGGSAVDRRFGEELLDVLSPLGVAASLRALERQEAGQDERYRALANQVEQLRYESRRAHERYDEVDPRNRLVAAELERRWNERLEQLSALEAELAVAEQRQRALGEEERKAILALGRHFEAVWCSAECPAELKKKIVHTVIEEVIADSDDVSERLNFVVHWRGGSHTRVEMDRPKSGAGEKTAPADLDVIRTLAVRYGDKEIAGVLNKLGRRTGKGKRWNQSRVKSARVRASIRGRGKSLVDPDILNMAGAARAYGVSDTTIGRLVTHGLVTNHQVVPYAPWELRRQELESEPVRSVLARLRKTGKLVLTGVGCSAQQDLFK